MRTKHLSRTIVFRVDDALFEALKADAKTNERTIAQTVRHKLRELCAS